MSRTLRRLGREHTGPWTVCPEGRGQGSYVHPAVSVWTESDRDEDPEGFSDMLRGDYDVSCEVCEGRRVVPDTTEFQEELAYEAEAAATYRMETGAW